jgi:hypothetical protein
MSLNADGTINRARDASSKTKINIQTQQQHQLPHRKKLKMMMMRKATSYQPREKQKMARWLMRTRTPSRAVMRMAIEDCAPSE